jgi:hypothetical protein
VASSNRHQGRAVYDARQDGGIGRQGFAGWEIEMNSRNGGVGVVGVIVIVVVILVLVGVIKL